MHIYLPPLPTNDDILALNKQPAMAPTLSYCLTKAFTTRLLKTVQQVSQTPQTAKQAVHTYTRIHTHTHKFLMSVKDAGPLMTCINIDFKFLTKENNKLLCRVSDQISYHVQSNAEAED